jgi:hypothetical protein
LGFSWAGGPETTKTNAGKAKARQMNEKEGCKLKGCSAAGLQPCRAAALQGCRAAGLQPCRAAGLQGCRAAALPGYRAAGLQAGGCSLFQRIRAY